MLYVLLLLLPSSTSCLLLLALWDRVSKKWKNISMIVTIIYSDDDGDGDDESNWKRYKTRETERAKVKSEREIKEEEKK